MGAMTTEEFYERFDAGGEVSSALDTAAVRRPGLEQRRVNVDFPTWMIEALDLEANLWVPTTPSAQLRRPSGTRG